MGKINYRTDDINNKLKQIDELVGINKNLSNQINNFNSQLDTNTKQLESLEINVKFPPGDLEGLKCDGTDQYNKLLNIINYIRNVAGYKSGTTLIFPRGEYSFSKIPMFSYINIKGEGKRNTIFKALQSSETGLFYLAQAPVLFSNYEGFTAWGINTLNPNQSCFKIHAQFFDNSAGGCWYCNFKNIEIRDFAKACLEFSVESISVSLANQFLYFENVQGFRPNTDTSRCILGGGNQFNYKSCEFSNVTPSGIGTNIETEGLCTFDLLTCQNADYAFIYKGGSLVLNNVWFENVKYSITDKSNENSIVNSVINVYGGNFANASSDGSGGGYVATTTSINTIINLFSPMISGNCDKVYLDANNTQYGINVYGMRENGNYISKKTIQVATLETMSNLFHRSTVLINNGGIIQNIDENYQTGETITIKSLGTTTLKSGGNIGITKNIELNSGDSVTLIKADISSKWWVLNIFKSSLF